MAVYVDRPLWRFADRRWCHLLADTPEELHGFAAKLGITRQSYQGPPKTSAPHYDITGLERSRALALGAVACGREEIVAVFRRVRVKNGKRRDQAGEQAARPAPPGQRARTGRQK